MKLLQLLALEAPENPPKKTEFANSIDKDEVAHNEPPHLDLQCLQSILWILNTI